MHSFLVVSTFLLTYCSTVSDNETTLLEAEQEPTASAETPVDNPLISGQDGTNAQPSGQSDEAKTVEDEQTTKLKAEQKHAKFEETQFDISVTLGKKENDKKSSSQPENAKFAIKDVNGTGNVMVILFFDRININTNTTNNYTVITEKSVEQNTNSIPTAWMQSSQRSKAESDILTSNLARASVPTTAQPSSSHVTPTSSNSKEDVEQTTDNNQTKDAAELKKEEPTYKPVFSMTYRPFEADGSEGVPIKIEPSAENLQKMSAELMQNAPVEFKSFIKLLQADTLLQQKATKTPQGSSDKKDSDPIQCATS